MNFKQNQEANSQAIGICSFASQYRTVVHVYATGIKAGCGSALKGEL